MYFLTFVAIIATGTKGTKARIGALVPVSGSNDSCKSQEMHLISKLGILHPYGINEPFSYI